MLGGEHSLKMLAPQLLRLGIDSVLKILNVRITYRMHELINYEGVYRTAQATPGLLKIVTEFHNQLNIVL